MIAKKNAGFNLEKRRSAVFGIGLLAASSFTLAAFTYTSPLEVEEAKIMSKHEAVYYSVADPAEEQPKEILVKEVPKTEEQKEITVELDPEISADSRASKNASTVVKSGVNTSALPFNHGKKMYFEPRSVDNDIIDIPDEDAEFIGGYVKMQEFIGAHIDYPEISIVNGDSGRVGVVFVVEKDGSISNISISKHVSPELDKEAIRIVKSFPNWKPAMTEGRIVRTRVHLPIVFRLK